MLEKTLRNLKIIYWGCVIVMLAAFVWDVLYVSKYIDKYAGITPNTGLEQWAIIITLGGIFATLKFLHPRLNAADKQNKETAIKKYAMKYMIRLNMLIYISIFNLICLYNMAAENFKYLAFISIFAMFLCIPNKAAIDSETGI